MNIDSNMQETVNDVSDIEEEPASNSKSPPDCYSEDFEKIMKVW